MFSPTAVRGVWSLEPRPCNSNTLFFHFSTTSLQALLTPLFVYPLPLSLLWLQLILTSFFFLSHSSFLFLSVSPVLYYYFYYYFFAWQFCLILILKMWTNIKRYKMLGNEEKQQPKEPVGKFPQKEMETTANLKVSSSSTWMLMLLRSCRKINRRLDANLSVASNSSSTSTVVRGHNVHGFSHYSWLS